MSDADPLSALLHSVTAHPGGTGDVLFMNGIFGPGVTMDGGTWHVVQPFKPEADRWPSSVVSICQDHEIVALACSRALVLVPKQHDAARHDLALAACGLPKGGVLWAAGANDAGGRRIEKDLQMLGFSTTPESRHKSRVVLACREGPLHENLMADWIAGGDWQTVLQGRFLSRPGLFSWDRIDTGSALLAAHIPSGLQGRGADFGCGYGYLSVHILQGCANVLRLYAVDADARAVEACRRNTLFADDRVDCLWHDLTTHPSTLSDLDFVVMNPPFHEGSLTQNQLGRAFIRAAHACLRPGGRLLMVANSHLPYEDTLKELFSQTGVLAVAQGYKVIEAWR